MKTNTLLNNLFTAAISLTLAGAANASITVINGGFEDTTGMTQNGEFFTGSIPGWTFSGITAEIATTAAYGSPAGVTGNNHLEAFVTDPGHLGTLSQSIAGFNVGQDYILTFDWGNREDLGQDYDFEFDVAISGQTFSQYGTTPLDMSSAQIEFTAANTTETIDITFHYPGNYSYTDGALDNFAVSTVPEPSSTALIGIAGMAMILRRRKTS